ncbi:MAG: TOBE domain-containing protein [Thermoplasmata archaeon]
MSPERFLTPTDRRLLEALPSAGSVAGAARRIGIPRDRAVYRLARLARLYGGPVARSRRGAGAGPATRLTALGLRLRAASAAERPDRIVGWRGTYRGGSPPRVALRGGGHLAVAFRAREGEAVTVGIPPEAVLLAPGRFPSSARNVLPAVVERIAPGRAPDCRNAMVRWGRRRLWVALTAEAARALRLGRGRRIVLYVKAVAVRRLDAAGG